MGPKQTKNQNDTFVLLICPNCAQRIPNFEIFLENSIIKIKIYCQCLEKQKMKQIFNLKDFLQKLKNTQKKIKKCTFSKDNNNAMNFCLNCEKWLCEKCNIEHNRNNCFECSKKQTNDNCSILTCQKHPSRKNGLYYFCKICKTFLCQQCCFEHDSINKKQHNIIRWIDYLDDIKLENKKNKFQKSEKIFNEENLNKIKILKDILNEKKNDEKKKIESLINNNQENNKNIFELIEILFKNIMDIKQIKNKKMIINIVNNTQFKMQNLQINENESIENKKQKLIKFYNTNYLNIHQTSQLNYLTSFKNSNEQMNCLVSLPENKFCFINSDSTIKIYNGENNIQTLSGHTNKIISVIMLRDEKRLISISNDSTIKIWEISTGKDLKTIVTYNIPMIILEIKGKENLIAELNLGNIIDIYDINTGEKQLNKVIEQFNWFESFYQLNNKDYLLGKFESVFIYNENLELKKEKKICGQTPINYLEISNGDIFIGSREGLIFVFDNLYNFKCKLLGHQETISGIIDYNEKYIMTCSYDTSIKIWEKNNYECENTFEGNSYQIISMIKITNGNIVTISLNPENIIDFWKLEEF